jgi:hypothetical protein
MIDHTLTIFTAPVNRRGAVTPEVCAKSLLNDTAAIFHPRRRSLLTLSTSQTALFLAFRTHQKSIKSHSNRISIPDTAPFK